MNRARTDAAIAALFAIALTIEALFIANPHGDSRALTTVLGVAMVASLSLRRTRPEPAAWWFAGVVLLQGIVGNCFLFDDTEVPFFAVVFAIYSLGRYGRGRQFWLAVAGFDLSVVFAVAVSRNGFEDAGSVVWFFMLFALPLVAGRAVRSRVLLQRELRDKAARAEDDRARRARAAIEQERERIASELQSVVANGVSAMVIQAEAVPRLIAAQDTAAAGQALGAIEETGRDALVEMRRLLGVLRRDDDDLALAPQPGLARLEALVERQRERGLDVELKVEGDERPLSTGIDLTAYRVLEDALQAAQRQRAERASVVLRYGYSDVELEVRDDRSGGASARFTGLRDRVGLYGGHISVGRENGADFTLRARLPIAEGVR